MTATAGRASRRMRRVPPVVVAALVVLLAGCGEVGGGSAGAAPGSTEVGCAEWPVCETGPTAGTANGPATTRAATEPGVPAPAPAARSASVTATPHGACPDVEGLPATAACVPYDPEAAMRANEGYRQRAELPADVAAAGERHLERIRTVLQEAVGRGPLTPEGAVDVLAAAGYPGGQAHGRSDAAGGLAVGVGTGSGCVYGGVRDATVELDVGGLIADGGCLPAPGH